MKKKNHALYDSLTVTQNEDKIQNTFDDETLDYMFDMEEDIEDLGELDED